MARKRVMGAIHLASTIWFIFCVGYILVEALLEAGVRWWVVFSLSGHGVLIVLLLVSLYLFAVYRGVSSSQKVRLEHPLTSTSYYMGFYVLTPCLGGLAGFLGMLGLVGTTSQFILGVAMGTLVTTFVVWVIIDPLVGLLETLLDSQSRRHRTERIARAKALREERQKARDRLLEEVFEQAESDLRSWRQELSPKAERLAELLTTGLVDFERAEREAVDIGVGAWRLGGMNCMRTLHEMVLEICGQRFKETGVIDYIPVWWDGVGGWRSTSLNQLTGS